jgi:hypothetical protein
VLPELGQSFEKSTETTEQSFEMRGWSTECSWVWRLWNKAALLMGPCNFQVSNYTSSGRVVKRVLSFYSFFPQTSFNYKLDLYPGLFMAWPIIISYFKQDC